VVVDVPEAKERRLAERAADRLENGVSAAKPSPSKSPSKRKPPAGDEEADDADDDTTDDKPAAGEGGGGGGKRRGPDTGGWVMIHKGDNKAFFSNLCCKRDELKLSGKVRVTHFTLSGASRVAPLGGVLTSAGASSPLALSVGCGLTRDRPALDRG